MLKDCPPVDEHSAVERAKKHMLRQINSMIMTTVQEVLPANSELSAVIQLLDHHCNLEAQHMLDISLLQHHMLLLCNYQ